MNRVLMALIAVVALASQGAFAKGDAAAGKALAVTCAACHGAAGVSPTDQWPNLAGQGEAYIIKQLKAFREGTRTDPLMNPQARALTDADIENAAAYFSSLSSTAAADAAATPAVAADVPHPPIATTPDEIAPRAHPTRQYWGNMLPEGEGRAIVAVKCQFCHDLQRAIAFARPREQWQEVVGAMNRRGSPLTAEEIPVVVDYLTKNFGPDSPPIVGPLGTQEVDMKACKQSEWPKGSKDFRAKWKSPYNVWMSNQQGGNVDIYDPVSKKIVNRIPCISGADRVEFSKDGNTAYAPDRIEHNLTVIDTRTGAIKAKIPLVARPNTAVLSRDYKKLYIGIWPVRADEATKGYVQIVDLTTLKVIKTIETKGGIHDTWMSQDGKLLLAMSPSAKFMNAYDPKTDNLMYTCCTEAEIGTMNIESASDGSAGRIITSYSGYPGLIVADAKTGKELTRVPHPYNTATSLASGSEIYFNGIAAPTANRGSGFHGGEISPDGKNFWCITGSIVWRYELPSLKPLGYVQLSAVDQMGKAFRPAVEGTWLTISPDGDKVFAVRPGRDLLSVIDVKTMKEETLVPTGEYPLHISVWPRGTP